MAGINIVDCEGAFFIRALAGKTAARQKRQFVLPQIVPSRDYGKLLQSDRAFLATSLGRALDDDAAADRAQRQKFQIEAGSVFTTQRNAARRRSQVSLLVVGSGCEDVFAVGQALKRKPSGAARLNVIGSGGRLRPRVIKCN